MIGNTTDKYYMLTPVGRGIGLKYASDLIEESCWGGLTGGSWVVLDVYYFPMAKLHSPTWYAKVKKQLIIMDGCFTVL
jgi:hypothetical protein